MSAIAEPQVERVPLLVLHRWPLAFCRSMTDYRNAGRTATKCSPQVADGGPEPIDLRLAVSVVGMVAVVRSGDAERSVPEVQDVNHGSGRQVVLISGSPGAGKSTLAVPLAEALGFPLLSKDVIKETLFDSIGDFQHDIVATSDALDPAAMSLLWRLAADSRQVVMEANFKPGTDHEANIRGLSDRPVEVYCRVAPEVAFNRYNQRGQRSDRHRVHYTNASDPIVRVCW